jgi:hypothetical protein
MQLRNNPQACRNLFEGGLSRERRVAGASGAIFGIPSTSTPPNCVSGLFHLDSNPRAKRLRIRHHLSAYTRSRMLAGNLSEHHTVSCLSGT